MLWNAHQGKDSITKIHSQSSLDAYVGQSEEEHATEREVADGDTNEERVTPTKHVTAKDKALEVVSLMRDMNLNDKDSEFDITNRLLDTCHVDMI